MKPWDDLTDEERKPYLELAKQIVSGLYFCSRVWEARGYGTMSEDDFAPAEDDINIVYDGAKALYDFEIAKEAAK